VWSADKERDDVSFAPNLKFVVVKRQLHLTADASARLDDPAAHQGVNV
jgi:hypothetical protein